jgi:hypothetical protein
MSCYKESRRVSSFQNFLLYILPTEMEYSVHYPLPVLPSKLVFTMSFHLKTFKGIVEFRRYDLANVDLF